MSSVYPYTAIVNPLSVIRTPAMRLRISRYSGLMLALSKSKRIDLLTSVMTRPMAVRRVSAIFPRACCSCASSASRACRYSSACCSSPLPSAELGGFVEREVGAAEWLDKAAAFPAATLKLTEARQYTAAAQAQDERYWIRSEAEADMFWPVRCPGVPPGP